MKVTFLGVGEAFDETQTNVCLLVEAAGRRMLMECGANAPSAVWKKSTRADYLDGIFISHFHADHTFGLPALVMRMWEDGRTRPFYLFGPIGSQRHIERLMEMAYPGMTKPPHPGRTEQGGHTGGLPFTLRFRELQRSHRWDDWNLRVVSTRHSVPNLGLRLEAGSPQKVFCYSGDGMFTPTAAKLYTGANLLVHEAYLEDGQTKTHCSLMQLERLHDLARPERMALVHLRRDLRKRRDEIIKRYRRRKWTIPEAGDSVTC